MTTVLHIIVEVDQQLADELTPKQRVERMLGAMQHLFDSRRRHGTRYVVREVIDATDRETPNE